MLDPSLCIGHINFRQKWCRYDTCDSRAVAANFFRSAWFRSAFLLMCGLEETCVSVFCPTCSSCNETSQHNCVEVLLGTFGINYIRPSVRYFDHVFEELRIHKWSRAITLNCSNVCVIPVPRSLLFITFCVTNCHWQASTTSWICGSDLTKNWRSCPARADFFRCIPQHTIVFHRCECRAGPICLSRAPRCTAWRKSDGLGAIGLVLVAVRIENGMTWVEVVGCWWRCGLRMG